MDSVSETTPLSKIATAAGLGFMGIPVTGAQAAIALEVAQITKELPPESRLLLPFAAAATAAAFQLSADYLTARRTGQFNNPVSQAWAMAHPGKTMESVLMGALYGYVGMLTNPVDYAMLAGFIKNGNSSSLVCILATHQLSGVVYSLGTNLLINFGLAQAFTNKVNPIMEKAQLLGQHIRFSQKLAALKSKIQPDDLLIHMENHEAYFQSLAHYSQTSPFGF